LKALSVMVARPVALDLAALTVAPAEALLSLLFLQPPLLPMLALNPRSLPPLLLLVLAPAMDLTMLLRSPAAPSSLFLSLLLLSLLLPKPLKLPITVPMKDPALTRMLDLMRATTAVTLAPAPAPAAVALLLELPAHPRASGIALAAHPSNAVPAALGLHLKDSPLALLALPDKVPISA
jgi:hypothetical protein